MISRVPHPHRSRKPGLHGRVAVLVLVCLALALAAAFVLVPASNWSESGWNGSSRSHTTNPSAPSGGADLSPGITGTTLPTAGVLPVSFSVLAPDQRRSSWQNPFQLELWHAPGWVFESESMSHTELPATPATFLQPYERLMLEFDVANSDLAANITSGAVEEATSPPPLFEIRLIDLASGHYVAVECPSEHVLLREVRGADEQILRQVPLPVPASPRFRVTATGNRLLVAQGDQLLINAPQPSCLSNRFVVQLNPLGGTFTVAGLRIEGE